MIKAVARRLLPVSVREAIRPVWQYIEGPRQAFHLSRLRRRASAVQPPGGAIERLGDYSARVPDRWPLYAVYKDAFINDIYHFTPGSRAPLILDCGSNFGGTILYFKHLCPAARIIGFEPDPVLFPFLQENVARNELTDVRLIQAGLAAREGTAALYSDGRAGSTLKQNLSADARKRTRYDVPCVRLRDFLTEPVDFMKMNIEGAEWEVLSDSEDRLGQVAEMVIEYHHLPGLPRTLHKILTMLDRLGFEYLINHFDYDTNPQLRPPFHLSPGSRYYLLIYAKRMTS